MRQFLVPPGCSDRTTLEVKGKEFHYLSHVRRLRDGDIFTGTDGAHQCFRITVLKREYDRIILSLNKEPSCKPLILPGSACGIILIQSIPKGAAMDRIIRQATELGVEKIIPVISEHTVPRAVGSGKIHRWRRIAREALQQSGCRFLPEICDPIHMQKFLNRQTGKKGKVLFFHQDSSNSCSLHGLLAEHTHEISILIGPEGGFSEQEISDFHAKGFSPACLGDNILRTETAAIAAIASVKLLSYEKRSWKIAGHTGV